MSDSAKNVLFWLFVIIVFGLMISADRDSACDPNSKHYDAHDCANIQMERMAYK